MNDPTYYRNSDHPSPGEQEQIWHTVKRHLPGRAPTGKPIHWKSFWIGQAAAILLILALIGAHQVWTQAYFDRSASENDFRQVYRTSLEQMADAGRWMEFTGNEPEQDAAQSLIRGLNEVDRIIEEMRNDMLLNGSTQAKRRQLRRLYATKLNFVQKLILIHEEPS